jgi:hypothetical protein
MASTSTERMRRLRERRKAERMAERSTCPTRIPAESTLAPAHLETSTTTAQLEAPNLAAETTELSEFAQINAEVVAPTTRAETSDASR